MLFLKNITNYFDKKGLGVCPVCGEDLSIEIYNSDIKDSYDVICRKCKKTEHYDGITKIK